MEITRRAGRLGHEVKTLLYWTVEPAGLPTRCLMMAHIVKDPASGMITDAYLKASWRANSFFNCLFFALNCSSGIPGTVTSSRTSPVLKSILRHLARNA